METQQVRGAPLFKGLGLESVRLWLVQGKEWGGVGWEGGCGNWEQVSNWHRKNGFPFLKDQNLIIVEHFWERNRSSLSANKIRFDVPSRSRHILWSGRPWCIMVEIWSINPESNVSSIISIHTISDFLPEALWLIYYTMVAYCVYFLATYIKKGFVDQTKAVHKCIIYLFEAVTNLTMSVNISTGFLILC